MSKYRSIGHRYLSFCWKAYRIGRGEALERWAVRFMDEQWSLLQDVVEELENDWVLSSRNSGLRSGREGEADSEGEYEGNSSEDESEDKSTTGLQYSVLDQAVFNFIVALIKT